MKLIRPLFVGSLIVNAVLLAVFLRDRPASNPPADELGLKSPDQATITNPRNTAQAAAFRSDNIDELKKAGLPDDVARMLVAGRAYLNLQTRLRAARTTPDTDGRYWRNTSSFIPPTKEQRLEAARAQREFAEIMRTTFAGDANAYAYAPVDTRYAFLSASKREQLRRVEQDYNEMQGEIYADSNGIQLPSDREKLKLLQQEKERDIAAVMTPEEFEQFNLRSSRTAQSVRNRYGSAIQTEEEYKKIFALQKAFDDRLSANSDQFMLENGLAPDRPTAATRRAAEAQLQDDIRSALGPENFAALQRANDQDYKTLTSVAKRLNLPPETADAVFASRDTYAAASQRINADPSLSVAARRAQLATLATQARAHLAQTLGSEGAEVYAARANWLSMLKNGTAFSTNPKDAAAGRTGFSNSSVYSLSPPRPPAPARPKK